MYGEDDCCSFGTCGSCHRCLSNEIWSLESKVLELEEEVRALRTVVATLQERVSVSEESRRDALQRAFEATSEELGDTAVKYARGEADGRRGHPPAELTAAYLAGYAAGQGGR